MLLLFLSFYYVKVGSHFIINVNLFWLCHSDIKNIHITVQKSAAQL